MLGDILGGLLSSQQPSKAQFIDVISMFNGNMQHACAFKFD